MGEPDLVRAHRREVRFHGHPRHEAVAVRVGEVQERAVVADRRGLEHDAVVAGVERAAGRGEHEGEEVALALGGAQPEVQAIRFGDGLAALAADVEAQRLRPAAALRRAMAAVERQHEDVAPVARLAQRGEAVDGLAHHRVHLAAHLVVAVVRREPDRAPEGAVRELAAHALVARAQRGRAGRVGVGPRARERGRGAEQDAKQGRGARGGECGSCGHGVASAWTDSRPVPAF